MVGCTAASELSESVARALACLFGRFKDATIATGAASASRQVVPDPDAARSNNKPTRFGADVAAQQPRA